MQEQEYKSPLKTAICEFKKLGLTIKKESSNPFFKSKYADLANILDVIEIKAATCGLVITSSLGRDADGMSLTTTLEHKDSDEKKESSFPVVGLKPQEIGSSVTYARRYNIQSLLNLAAEDDDGNAASNIKPTAKAKKDRWTEIMKGFDDIKNSEDLSVYWVSITEDLKDIKFRDEESYIKLYDRKEELKKLFNGFTNG
jgi:hypothetical protein